MRVKAKFKRARVESCRPTKTGGMIIKATDTSTVDALKNIGVNQENLRRPMIVISDVPTIYDNNLIYEAIRDQNSNVREGTI